uniref:Rap-GAP domain-containing protein n=1 Tax=Schistosoma mansoni TaxID=6183 RepID=A0A5K4F030_SCHMA
MSSDEGKSILASSNPSFNSNNFHPTYTTDTFTKYMRADLPSSSEMFITLHYDSRSMSHSLLSNYRNPASVEISTDSPVQKPKENKKSIYNLVAESSKFIVEGNENNDNYASSAHRYTVNFSKVCSSQVGAEHMDYYDFEYRDSGACFYRNSIFSCGDQHQNWFGIIPNDGAIAISLVKTSIYFKSNYGTSPSEDKQSHSNTANISCKESNCDKNLPTFDKQTESKNPGTNLNYLPAWLVIVRREQGSDLRGCVINKSLIENNKSISSLIITEPNINNPTIHTSNNSLSSGIITTNLTNDNSSITEPSLKTSLSTTKSISLSSMNTTITTNTSNISQLMMMKKKLTKKNSVKLNDALFNVTDEQLVLQYLVKNDNIMDYLKPGVPDRTVYEKLLKLDEMELLNNHKFGVLLCRKNQSTEEEMYNNEHSTPEFEEFLKLLGRKVRLRNYSGYIGGLDYRNDSTGLETYVTEFRGTNIVFLVSTLLPYEPNKTEQLARKRHIGNSSVTFIFVEEDAMPFQPDTIISGFQKVFILVKYIRLNNDIDDKNDFKFGYRVAVCRAKDVPQFGPIISSDYLFEHNLSFGNLLLTKAINAAYAVLKYSKFREIMQRSRRDYLHQFCNEHTINTENENLKHGKIHLYRRHSQDKLKQLKNSIKFRIHVTSSIEHESMPIKYHFDRIIPFHNQNLKSFDDLCKINQRVKRNHSDIFKLNKNEYIHLSNTFHNLFDFGQCLYVGLKKWQKLDGWHSVMELLPNSLLMNNYNNSTTTTNNNNNSNIYSTDDSVHRHSSNNHYFETQIGINRNWLVIFAPYTISTALANKILLAIPLNSIFGCLFEHNRKVLRIYFDCGQYVQIQDIYNSYHSNEQNTLEQLINFISYCIYPKVLQKCSQIIMKIKNNSIHHNDYHINDNEKFLIHNMDNIHKTNDNDQLKETKETIHHLNNNHKYSTMNDNYYSISDIGLSLSCLSPIDNYNNINSSYSLSLSSPSSPSSLSLLSNLNLSSFSLNPFPYIINFSKKLQNIIDFQFNQQQQQINKQILLQINTYHLPELIRIIQSKKSIWCLQKLNIISPFYNIYFPIIYDIQFTTHLLTLINQLKFNKNIIKIILCDLPEIEIFNRARIRCRHNQYVKHNHNNGRNEIRFSYPVTLYPINHHHQYHDDRFDETNKDNSSLPIISLPYIINVSNVYSNRKIEIKRNSQDFLNFDEMKQLNRKYHSLDVQQILSNELYTNSQCQQKTDDKLVTKSDNETSIDFTSNGLPTINLIETANCVQSRRRTRKPELIFMKQSNHMDSSTVSPPKNEELCLNKETVIRISNSNHQDKNETNSEISNQSGTYARSVNDQNNSPTLENDKIQVTKISTINQNNLSESSLSTLNPDSNKTNDLSINNSSNSNADTTTHIPVKWRRAKTEKTNSHYNTDARIITIRRRLQSTGTNTWNTKLHENITSSKLEQSRPTHLTVNTNMKFKNSSIDYIPPIKQKSRLKITRETFTQSQNIYELNNDTMDKYNTEIEQNLTKNQLYDLTELNENQLRNHLRRINEELLMEQSRRNHLANMCADLLEENRKLRNGQSDSMNKQIEHQTVTTNTSTSLMNQPNETIYKNYNSKKAKLSFINGKIKQISSNPNIWRKSKVKSHSFNNEIDL